MKAERRFVYITYVAGHDPRRRQLRVGSVAHVSCRNKPAAQKQPVRTQNSDWRRFICTLIETAGGRRGVDLMAGGQSFSSTSRITGNKPRAAARGAPLTSASPAELFPPPLLPLKCCDFTHTPIFSCPGSSSFPDCFSLNPQRPGDFNSWCYFPLEIIKTSHKFHHYHRSELYGICQLRP